MSNEPSQGPDGQFPGGPHPEDELYEGLVPEGVEPIAEIPSYEPGGFEQAGASGASEAAPLANAAPADEPWPGPGPASRQDMDGAPQGRGGRGRGEQFDRGGRGGRGSRGGGGSRGRGRGEDRGAFDAQRLFEKQPPHSDEAEMGLLGSMLIDAQVVGEIIPIVSAADAFYRPAHMVIFDAILTLYNEAPDKIDGIQVKQRLADLGQLEDAGGVPYLIELAEGVPSATGAVHWAKIVRDKAILRNLIDAAGNILHKAYTTADEAGLQLDEAEQSIFQLAESKDSSQDATHLSILLQETYKKLEAQDGRNTTGVETGFTELDEMTSGLQPGEMIIIAARPSMGKTAFALNMAEHIGATNKLPVAVFSLEMSKQQLAQRLLCSRSGVDSHRLRRNRLRPEDFQDLSLTVGELDEAPIFIDDTPGLTLMGLRAKARRLAAKHDLSAVVIDYLQLMGAPGAESRQQEVSNISRGVKALARELKCPVICLSQLNRASESREGHKPRMSDLRESGSIEQDADVIMMLHREEYYHKDPAWAEENPEKVGVAEVILAKQRNGPTGVVTLTFDGSTTRFRNHHG